MMIADSMDKGENKVKKFWKTLAALLCVISIVGCSAQKAADTPTNTVKETTADFVSQATSDIGSAASQVSGASQTVSSKETSSSKAKSSDKSSKAAGSSHSSTAPKSSQASTAAKPVPAPKKDKNQTKIVHYIRRPTYASVQKEIIGLQKEYPELIQTESIGKSVQGRDLTLVKVGKGAAKACVVAGIHAREGMSVSYVMRCIEEFCAAYETKSGKFGRYDMKNLLDCYTLYIIPLINPDGLEIVAGRENTSVRITYRKDATLKDYKANANGVNLNKNFPLLWEAIDTGVNTPDPEKYKGTAPASEPETKALMALCEENDFMWMTSVHVRGDCIYWSDAESPSVGLSEQVANALKEQCDFYKCKTSDDVNGFGGGFENWFRAQYNRPGFCLELMPLTLQVTPDSNQNHMYFDSSVRWSVTKSVFPIIMIYGFIR